MRDKTGGYKTDLREVVKMSPAIGVKYSQFFFKVGDGSSVAG